MRAGPRAPFRRTALSSALLAGALAVSLGGWFQQARREAEREARAVEGAPEERARREADGLAAQLAARLGTLRSAESRRPYFHYQNLYHDPDGAYEGAGVMPSPLAQGPADPLVLAYFQVDARGRLSSPAVNDELPERNDLRSLADSVRALDALRPLADVLAPRGDAREGPRSREPAQHRLLLAPEAYAQNAESNQIYVDLSRRPARAAQPARKPAPALPVAIETGELAWSVLALGGREHPLALRRVETPAGPLAQGFVLDPGQIEAWLNSLRGAELPAALAAAPSGIASPVGDTKLFVTVDSVEAGRLARAEALALRQKFWWGFLPLALLTACLGTGAMALVLQAERLARQRSRFAASAAHELRTPLAGLRMYGEMLAEGLGDPSRSREYARRIADEAERLGRVVANVLGVTRLERGAPGVRPVEGDLAKAVASAIERARPALASLGADVELGPAPAAARALFDPDALAQILGNLLDNAEKYSREAPDRAIVVRVYEQGGRARVAVADRGPGLPSGLARSPFRAFRRGRGDDRPAGLGLGLAISRELARAQGGDLAYAPRPGGGAEFTLELPIARGATKLAGPLTRAGFYIALTLGRGGGVSFEP